MKASENILTTYFKEINKIPLLSRTEEDSLARRAKRGDRLAWEKLIQGNLRFVVNVAKNLLGSVLGAHVGEVGDTSGS